MERPALFRQTKREREGEMSVRGPGGNMLRCYAWRTKLLSFARSLARCNWGASKSCRNLVENGHLTHTHTELMIRESLFCCRAQVLTGVIKAIVHTKSCSQYVCVCTLSQMATGSAQWISYTRAPPVIKVSCFACHTAGL